jgi:hypothetical protein
MMLDRGCNMEELTIVAILDLVFLEKLFDFFSSKLE